MKELHCSIVLTYSHLVNVLYAYIRFTNGNCLFYDVSERYFDLLSKVLRLFNMSCLSFSSFSVVTFTYLLKE